MITLIRLKDKKETEVLLTVTTVSKIQDLVLGVRLIKQIESDKSFKILAAAYALKLYKTYYGKDSEGNSFRVRVE